MPLSPFGDKCLQSSITTTTAAYQVTTNVGAFKTWRSQFADGSDVFYYAENSDASIWEEGFGTLTYGSPDTISRTAVLQSSTGSTVDWSGVTVYIFSAPVGRANPGRYVNAKTMWVPENRRPTTAVGAANKTIAAADVGGIFTLDNTAASRTVTLPTLASVGEGFGFRFMGLSLAFLLSLTPNGSEAIDYSSGGTTVALPGRTWIEVWSDGSQWRTTYPYSQPVKFLEYAPSGAASVDTGSIIPSWVNVIEVVFDLTHATDAQNSILQTYNSGGTLDTGGADYTYVDFGYGSTSSSAVGTATALGILLGGSVDNSSTIGISGSFKFTNFQGGQRPNVVGKSTFLDSAGTIQQAYEISGRRNATTRLTGFKISAASGNVSGNVRAYASA